MTQKCQQQLPQAGGRGNRNNRILTCVAYPQENDPRQIRQETDRLLNRIRSLVALKQEAAR